MLKVPTDVPQDLAHLYANYQLTVLNSIRLDDEEIEADGIATCTYRSSTMTAKQASGSVSSASIVVCP
jgi:hypothetical protein